MQVSAERGAAVERVLLLVCLIWIAVGLVWWLLPDDDEGGGSVADSATPAAEPAAEGPALKGAGEEGKPSLRRTDPVAERLRRLAGAWMFKGGARPEDELWLAAWLAEDPSRVIGFIDHLLATPGTYGMTRRLVRLGYVVAQLKIDCLGVLMAHLEAHEGLGGAQRRAAWLMAVGSMGKEAAAALPLLRRMMGDVDVLDVAALHLPLAVVNIAGKTDDAVPLLDRILRSDERWPDPSYELHLLQIVIPRLGPHGEKLASALADYVAREDVNAMARYAAMGLLGSFSLDLDTRRRAVLAALRWSESRLQGRVLSLVQGLPEEDLLSFIPTLERTTGRARVQGVAALLRAGVDGKRLGYLVVPCLQHEDLFTREQAVRLLPLTVKDVDEVLPVAAAMLAGTDAKLWTTATRALGALTSVPGDRRAVTRELVGCVGHIDPTVRKLAVQSLLMFDDQTAAIVPMLGELLRDDNAKIRAEAVDALGELSAHEPTARAVLERALADPDDHVRSVARYWLKTDGDDDGD